jgi:hypothetical protein
VWFDLVLCGPVRSVPRFEFFFPDQFLWFDLLVPVAYQPLPVEAGFTIFSVSPRALLAFIFAAGRRLLLGLSFSPGVDFFLRASSPPARFHFWLLRSSFFLGSPSPDFLGLLLLP